MGPTGQILHTPLAPVHWCKLAPVKSKDPWGSQCHQRGRAARWFVQGGDLGGHIRAFKVQTSRDFRFQLTIVHVPPTGAVGLTEIQSQGSGGEGGSTGGPQNPVPSLAIPGCSAGHTVVPRGGTGLLGWCCFGGSIFPETIPNMPSSSPSVNEH